MTSEVIRALAVVAVALIGSGFGLAWRKLGAEARSINVATDGDLRRQLRDLDTELAEQRKRRMDLQDALSEVRVTLARVRAELATVKHDADQVRSECDANRHRVEKLEAWIIDTTGVDPSTINGWRDT